MLQRAFFLFLIYFSCFYLSTLAETYPEVLFDNSTESGSYAKSQVSYSGKSWVENLNKRLLVSNQVFFTPGNALSLRYRSHQSGNWQAVLYSGSNHNDYKIRKSDILNLRMRIQTSHTALEDLPKISLVTQSNKVDTLVLKDYVEKLEIGKWLHVKIPLKDFKNLPQHSAISHLTFSQYNASSTEHHILLDQIEFLPQKYPELKLRSAAVLTEVKGYDRVVQLKWQLPLSPSIRYIKIYRSDNNKDFIPVSIRPIHMQSCFDHVPLIGKKYQYKIAWVDYDYDESPLSAVKEAETKPLNDEELITLMQLSHINYFVENFDVNSGMYLPQRTRSGAVVSTQETAGAILALIVGAENKFISRQMALSRISKITYFLMKSQQINGVFPAFFDGRKGVPQYIEGADIYDVQATAAILEALLIAKQYFAQEDEVEFDLRNRISALYNQVNWQSLRYDAQSEALKSKFSIINHNLNQKYNYSNLLAGDLNVINTYLMAIGASKNNLSPQVYYDAIYYKYGKFNTNTLGQSLKDELDRKGGDFYTQPVDSLVRTSILHLDEQFGLELPVQSSDLNLLSLYRIFNSIQPNSVKDSLLDWEKALNASVNYQKRKDNEHSFLYRNSAIWGTMTSMSDTSSLLNPVLAPSSVMINKEVGIASLRAIYEEFGDILFSDYGFRAWLDVEHDRVASDYWAANQSLLVVSLENAKSGLIWKLYAEIPEIQRAKRLLFSQNISPQTN